MSHDAADKASESADKLAGPVYPRSNRPEDIPEEATNRNMTGCVLKIFLKKLQIEVLQSLRAKTLVPKKCVAKFENDNFDGCHIVSRR